MGLPPEVVSAARRGPIVSTNVRSYTRRSCISQFRFQPHYPSKIKALRFGMRGRPGSCGGSSSAKRPPVGLFQSTAVSAPNRPCLISRYFLDALSYSVAAKSPSWFHFGGLDTRRHIRRLLLSLCALILAALRLRLTVSSCVAEQCTPGLCGFTRKPGLCRAGAAFSWLRTSKRVFQADDIRDDPHRRLARCSQLCRTSCTRLRSGRPVLDAASFSTLRFHGAPHDSG